MPLSETDLAYCAGIVDGEGSISASVTLHCQKNIRILLAVAMCDEEVPALFARLFGGHVCALTRLTKTGKRVYSWSAYCKNAASILDLLLPYLRVKHERASNAIQLAKLMRPKRDLRRVISETEISDRNDLALKIRKANFVSNGRIAKHAIKSGVN